MAKDCNETGFYKLVCEKRFDALEDKTNAIHDTQIKQGANLDALLSARKWVIGTLTAIAVGVVIKVVWSLITVWPEIIKVLEAKK